VKMMKKNQRYLAKKMNDNEEEQYEIKRKKD
jgi:hypothetical protein